MRHQPLLMGIFALLPFFSIAQSSDIQEQKLESQVSIYANYLDLALDNWCVFFDKNGIDPSIYSEDTADRLTNAPYNEELNKKLLLAAFKCEYNSKRLTYIDQLISKDLVTEKEKINLLQYGAIYAQNNVELRKKKGKYLDQLENLLADEEYTSFKNNLDSHYGEMDSFNSVMTK